MRDDGLLTLVIEERMESKRPRGMLRMGMIDNIMMGSYEHIKRRAPDREGWRV